ncbi:MAG: rRNA biogenesis protein rrp5 [Oscillospiraceae bacterium]
MSKVAILLDAVIDVIANVRSLADSLQKTADVLADLNDTELKANAVDVLPKKIEKSYTLEDVRGVLAEKSQKGHTAEVKELIVKFGGNKLSDISPDKYGELIKLAEEFDNG